MDKPKLRAVFPTTRQIGPSDWQSYTRVMDLTPETTVAEILAWHDESHKGDRTPVITLIVER